MLTKGDNYNLTEITAWIEKYRKSLPVKIKGKAPSIENLIRILQEVYFEADDDYFEIPPQSPDRGWYSPLLNNEQKTAVFIYLFSIYNASGKAKRDAILEGTDKSLNDNDSLIEIVLEYHDTELADELVKRNTKNSGTFCFILAKKMLMKKIVIKEWVNLIWDSPCKYYCSTSSPAHDPYYEMMEKADAERKELFLRLKNI